jgi:hypothetical protein
MQLTLVLLMLFPMMLSAIDPEQKVLPTPVMRVVEPATVKAGAEVTVTGDNLNKELIAAVYLITDNAQIEVKVLSQSEKELTFKVAADVKPGRYRIGVLTTTAEPAVLEEPVRLVVEE